MTQRKKKWIGVEVDLEDHGTFVAEAHQQSLRKGLQVDRDAMKDWDVRSVDIYVTDWPDDRDQGLER